MKAPALEKGLEVLEVLVAEGEGLTLSQIASRCERSVSEIQRMVHVLLKRGYIDRTEAGAYFPGLKLYELGRFRHPFRHLQSVAEPIMARVAEATGHSIHLSVEDRGEMLILSEIIGSGVASIALKIGSRHPLDETLSGRILLLNAGARAKSSDRKKVTQEGYLHLQSPLYPGVYDLGVPIRRSLNERIVGVLTCGWLKRKAEVIDTRLLGQQLIAASEEISASL